MRYFFLYIVIAPFFLFSEERILNKGFKFPLDARQLILPPLNFSHQDRDFSELLGIATTAPAPNSDMYFHADIPDSILDAGPVEAFIFYGNGQNSNWTLDDAYYLGTPGYENTFEAVAQTPSSGNMYIGVQADITFLGMEVVATQSPYNSGDGVPADWYLNVNDDPTGDSEINEQYMDIDEISVAVSDNRIHVHLSNVGGGFDVGGFFGPWNLYVVGFLNPEDPDSSLYGIGYGDGGFGLLYPGLWKFQLGADLPTFVGNIDYSINGDDLYMAANMSDIFNDPDFGPWPNEFESLAVTGLTVQASLSSMTIADQTDPAFMNPGFQSYVIGSNSSPQLSPLTYEITGDSSGMSLVNITVNYSDSDNHFPLTADYIISNWSTEYVGQFISYDHSYDDGSLFEVEIPLEPGEYNLTATFSDGMGTAESTATLEIGGAGGDYQVMLISGWNLVALSSNLEDPSQQSVFPSSIEETLYGFTDSYYLTSEFIPGSGYWLRFENADSISISGSDINELNISLTEGWNLIAGPTGEVSIDMIDDPDSLIVPNTLFGFDASGYTEANLFVPGYGYWVRSFGDGNITLQTGWRNNASILPLTRKKQGNLNKISINGKKLYFGNNNLSEKEKLSYTLPPRPPVGAKDIRFSDNTLLCSEIECIIEILNVNQLLSFNYEINKDELWEVIPVLNNQMQFDDVTLLSDQSEIILNSNVERLILRKTTFSHVSSKFTLYSSFPNPFNPLTTIRFYLPDISNVNIEIYNLQGQLIETLINKKMLHGEHSIQWNAQEFSNGVYFLNMRSDHFSQTEKLMLIK